jgi:hypothetical protein
MLIEISDTQRHALIDIILVYIRLKDEPQIFVDVVRDLEATAPELLNMLINVGEPRYL